MTTPTNRDALREMIARAVSWDGEPEWQLSDRLLSALDGAGIALVPREATGEMVRAVAWRELEGFDEIVPNAARAAYAKMLSASPFEKDRER